MEAMKTFLADCWRMFTDVQVPGLGISFANLWLGIFVVGVATMILRPLLGIGFGAANNIFTGVARAGKRGYDRSYAKYKRDRDRSTAYKKRYEGDK